MAVFGPILIYPGIWGAVLSSAFGSALGGPRVLQALAQDGWRRVPEHAVEDRSADGGHLDQRRHRPGGGRPGRSQRRRDAGHGPFPDALPDDQPGGGHREKLPAIRRTGRPSRCRGRCRCSVRSGRCSVMFLISPWACLLAAVLETAIWIYLRRRSMEKRWGDVRAGLWLALARAALLRLHRHEADPRNWRPHILVFVGESERNLGLVRLAGWFNQNRGVVTACRLIVGSLEDEGMDPKVHLRRLETTTRHRRTEGILRGQRRVGPGRGCDRRHPGQRHRRPAVEHHLLRLAQRQGAPRGAAAGASVGRPSGQVDAHRAPALESRAGSREAHRPVVGRPGEQRRHDAALRLSPGPQSGMGRRARRGALGGVDGGRSGAHGGVADHA